MSGFGLAPIHGEGQPVWGCDIPDDEPMSDEAIEAEKQRRLTNWIAHIETPATEE